MFVICEYYPIYFQAILSIILLKTACTIGALDYNNREMANETQTYDLKELTDQLDKLIDRLNVTTELNEVNHKLNEVTNKLNEQDEKMVVVLEEVVTLGEVKEPLLGQLKTELKKFKNKISNNTEELIKLAKTVLAEIGSSR